jgi:hypothetical protein
MNSRAVVWNMKVTIVAMDPTPRFHQKKTSTGGWILFAIELIRHWMRFVDESSSELEVVNSRI